MQVAVTFKNLDASDHFKNYLQDRMDRMDKLLDHPGIVNVVLRSEKVRKIAEVTLVADKLDIYAREESEDMQAAIDLVLDKIRKQITRNKGKIQDRRTRTRRKALTPGHAEVDGYAEPAGP